MSMADGLCHISISVCPQTCSSIYGGRYSGVTNHSLNPFNTGFIIFVTVSEAILAVSIIAE